MGNFQMSNSKATCVALSYDDIIYDEYCYNPIVSIPSISSQNTQSDPQNTQSNFLVYNNHIIQILSVNYDPEGNDTDRETITLLMTG
jgi:hypothetical protein